MIGTKIKKYIPPISGGRRNKNKGLITVICCIVLLVMAFVIFWDTISLILPDFDNAVYKFSYPTSQSRKFVPFKNSMIFCCSDGIYCIDNKGNEKWMVPIVFDQPIIAASDYGVVASSKNSKTVYAINEKGKTKEFLAQHPVLNLKISESGNILVVFDKPNYSGALEVYDNNGTPVFTWSAGTVNLIDASLSADGQKLAVSSIETVNSEVNCKIQVFDIYKSDQPYAENIIGNNMVSNVKWVNNNRIMCVGDKAFLTLDKNLNQKWAYDYNDQILNFVSIADKDNIVLALGSDALDLNMSVKSFNISGKLNSEFNYDGPIYGISSNDKRILVCGMANVSVYDKKSRLRETLKAEKEIYAGYLLNGNTVFLDEGGFAQLSNVK